MQITNSLNQLSWDVSCELSRTQDFLSPFLQKEPVSNTLIEDVIGPDIHSLSSRLRDVFKRIFVDKRISPYGHTGSLSRLVDTWLQNLPENPDTLPWIHTQEERTQWPVRKARWNIDWNRLKRLIRSHPQLENFSQDPIQRRAQYLRLAYRLSQSLPILIEENRAYDFFETILPTITRGLCLTGWHVHMESLFDSTHISSPTRENLFTISRLALRNLRREIVLHRLLPLVVKELHKPEHVSEILSNTHSRLSIQQIYNTKYSLEYTSTELLGQSEVTNLIFESCIHSAESQFQETWSRHYTLHACITHLQEYFTANSSKMHNLLEPILDHYKASLDKGTAPMLDSMEYLHPLYDKLQELLKEPNYDLYTTELKTIWLKFHEWEVPAPFSLNNPQSLAWDAIQRSELYRWAIKTRNLELKHTIEKRPPDALEKVASILPEFPKHSEELRSLWKTLQYTYTLHSQQDYLSQSKKEVTVALNGIRDRVLTHNAHLLQKIALDPETNKMTPFGGMLWGVAARLFTLPQTIETIPERILSCISRTPLPPINSELIITSLKSTPSLYLNLPLDLQQLPEVLDLIKTNPGLAYGVDKEKYELWLTDPAKYYYCDLKSRQCKEMLLLIPPDIAAPLFALFPLSVRNDREFARKCVIVSVYNILPHTPLLQDEDFMRQIVLEKGDLLAYAPQSLKSNKAFVLDLITRFPKALKYVDPTLLEDPEVIFKGCLKEPENLHFASESCKNNPSLILDLYTSLKGKKTRILPYIDPKLLQNPNFLLQALQIDIDILSYVHSSLLKDKDFLRQTVSINLKATWYIDPSLLEDQEFLSELHHTYPGIEEHLPSNN